MSRFRTAALASVTLLALSTVTGAAAHARSQSSPADPGLPGPAAPAASGAHARQHRSREVLVRYKDAAGGDQGERVARRHGAPGRERLESIPRTEVLQVPAGMDPDDFRARLAADPDVAYVQPDYIIDMDATPNDPFFPQQLNLHNTGSTGGVPDADIDAPEAWDLNTGSASVTIAVIDSSFDLSHNELMDNTWVNAGETGTDAQGQNKQTNGVDDDVNGLIDDVSGWDFTRNKPATLSRTVLNRDIHHGTHVAGIAAARGNNALGVAGTSWGSKIMALTTAAPGGAGLSPTAIIKAINYAAKMKAKVVNMSLSTTTFDQAFQDAIAANPSVLFVVAAGNEAKNNDTTPRYPCTYPVANIVCVGNATESDALHQHPISKTTGSNWGATTVDLAAPGTNVFSTVPGGQYEAHSGTSMASPAVAGAAAVVWSVNPLWTAAQVRTALLNGVDVVPAWVGKSVTGGRLNLNKAIRSQARVGTATVSVADTADDGAAPIMTVQYVAAAGGKSQATITQEGTDFAITDTAVTLSAGAGCALINAGKVTCPVAGKTALSMDGGDLDDTLAVAGTVTLPATLTGGTGKDILAGGKGTDSLNGGSNNDTLDGGQGKDTLTGSTGTDTVSYASRSIYDELTIALGRAGNGVAGENDTIAADVENVIGHDGPDRISGSTDANVIRALDGTDTVVADAGNDTVYGGIGDDTISYEKATTGVTVNLSSAVQPAGWAGTDTLNTIENVIGSPLTDNITGDGKSNKIDGGLGTDTLTGGDGVGVDTVEYLQATSGVTVNLALAGAQNTGGGGTDTLSGFENLFGSKFNDLLTGTTGNNVFRGYLGTDEIRGSTGLDTIDFMDILPTGQVYNIKLDLRIPGKQKVLTVPNAAAPFEEVTLTSVEAAVGGPHNDELIGNNAGNRLAGMSGADIIDGDDGIDRIDFSQTLDVGVTVDLSSDAPQTTGAWSGLDTIDNIEEVTGTAKNDVFYASSANNDFNGGTGGQDTVNYATGFTGVTVNLATAGPQNTVGSGTDSLVGIENLVGTSSNDTLLGNSVANRLDGLGGIDTLKGFGGKDGIDANGDAVNDTIDCGTDHDEVLADPSPNDPTTTGCEIVHRV